MPKSICRISNSQSITLAVVNQTINIVILFLQCLLLLCGRDLLLFFMESEEWLNFFFVDNEACINVGVRNRSGRLLLGKETFYRSPWNILVITNYPGISRLDVTTESLARISRHISRVETGCKFLGLDRIFNVNTPKFPAWTLEIL
jgi:hypothetical protein